MKGRIKDIVIYTILMGTIAVAMILLFGQNTSVLIKKELIPNSTLSWYKFDWATYFRNLATQIQDTTKLTFDQPTTNWYTGDNVIMAIGLNIRVVVNWIIFIVNILIYPIKIGGYMLNFLLALLGINTAPESSLYWLGEFARGMLNAEIAYI